MRRHTLIWLLGGTLAGVVCLSWAESHRLEFSRWLTADPSQFRSRVRITFGVLSGALCLPVLALSVYLWSRGRRALRVVAIVLAAAALGLAAMLWRLVWLTT